MGGSFGTLQCQSSWKLEYGFCINKFWIHSSYCSFKSENSFRRELVGKPQADQPGKKFVKIKQGSSLKPSHIPTERQFTEDENTASCHMTKKLELQSKLANPRARKSKDILL